MLQLAFTTRQSAANLAQRTGLPQLAKEHGNELAPASEPARMTFRSRLAIQLLEFHTRKDLQQLRKNAAYSVQGGISCSWGWFLSRNPT
jgi:hypothetical protein